MKTKFLAIALILLASSGLLHAKTPVNLCIWDPVGTHGPVFSFFFDLQLKALSWNIQIKKLAYETELETLDLLESGDCDVAVVTAILARQYVRFGGSLDAIGAITSQQQLKILLGILNAPKLRPALQQDNYEIAAVLPVGPMYAFVNDKKIANLRAFKNKKISALNGDVQTKKLAKVGGAKPIDTTISNFAELFKKGPIDIVLMPAIAYTAFELEQGMRAQGGIIDIRFFNGMLQAIANREQVPDHFAVELRRYMAKKTDDIFTLIRNAEEDIPEDYWIRTDQTMQAALENLLKDIRLELMVENKLDRRALKLLWKIRCKENNQRAECLG